MRLPWKARIVRIAIPAVVVGAVTTGIIVAASPNATQVAYPAPAGSIPSLVSPTAAMDRHQANSRAVSSARPSLSAAPTAKAAPSASVEPKAKPKPKPKPTAKPAPALKVVDSKYARVDLNIRTAAKQKADVVGRGQDRHQALGDQRRA